MAESALIQVLTVVLRGSKKAHFPAVEQHKNFVLPHQNVNLADVIVQGRWHSTDTTNQVRNHPFSLALGAQGVFFAWDYGQFDLLWTIGKESQAPPLGTYAPVSTP